MNADILCDLYSRPQYVTRSQLQHHPSRAGNKEKVAPNTNTQLHTPVNFLLIPKAPPNTSEDDLTDSEKQGLARGLDFYTMGSAYALEHATKPSTIGLVLASNPMALMAWYGQFHRAHNQVSLIFRER